MKLRSHYNLDIFATRLREARVYKGLSQVELGKKIGRHYSSVYKYESGAVDPTGKALFLISKALDVSVDWLLGVANE